MYDVGGIPTTHDILMKLSLITTIYQHMCDVRACLLQFRDFAKNLIANTCYLFKWAWRSIAVASILVVTGEWQPANAQQKPGVRQASNSSDYSGILGFGLISVMDSDEKSIVRSPRSRTWVDSEYVLWSLSHYSVPALVTSSSPATPPNLAGLLNSRTTTTLLGSEFGHDSLSGFRFGMGGWLEDCDGSSFEVYYTGLPEQGSQTTFNNVKSPVLARPVFDTTLGAEAANLVAYPNVLSGSLTVNGSATLHLIDAIFRDPVFKSKCSKLDAIFGFRFGALDESLSIEQNSRYLIGQGQILNGTTKSIVDQFDTRNRFYGAIAGLDYRERFGGSEVFFRVATAYGMNQRDVNINGKTINTVPGGGSATFNGGLLAQVTNIGDYSDTKMIVVPEISVRLLRKLSPQWQFNIGYSLLYWDNAARPGPQIDRRVSQYPPESAMGSGNPTFTFENSSVLIYGWQTGLLFTF